MTNFLKSDFEISGEYITYGQGRKFVARIKSRSPVTKSKFLKELIANHTVESYFDQLVLHTPPLAILRDSNRTWYDAIMQKFKDKR
jgi:hypothetical protein